MKALDAAYEVLKEAGEPLHYKKVTELILSQGRWETSSKDPSATVGSLLFVDVAKQGSKSRFKKAGKGVFALNDGWGPSVGEPAPGKTVPATADKMSFLDAAEKILQEHGHERPMPTRRSRTRPSTSG